MTSESNGPRIVRVKKPSHHFSYLIAPSGNYLSSTDGTSLALQGDVDDQAIWDRSGDDFRHVVTGLVVQATHPEVEQRSELLLGGTSINAEGHVDGNAACFTVGHGPEKMPSVYLETLKREGWVALTSILPASVVDGLQRVGCVEAYEGQEPVKVNPIAQDPAVTRATVEPVSLWLARQYMQTRDIKVGHPPGVSSLPPDDGKREVQGWHTDFPYLWGTGDRIPVSAGELVLGMQRNLCVSDFTFENGATRFKLGSHTSNQAPPAEWGVTNDTFRRGHRAEHGLPYGGPDAEVIEAPAGSIVLYDSRTWHCAGVNRTNRKRGAMIQAFIPGYIIPFMDTSATFKAFLSSDVVDQVTEHERRELDRLMVHKIRGPAGMFAITTDAELTQRAREQGGSGATIY